MDHSPVLLTYAQVADRLAVSRRTVSRMVEDKRLPVVVLPTGTRRIRESDVTALTSAPGEKVPA